jgi:hypothetical protein
MSQVLPMKFNYDESNRTLDVEFADNSVVRYFALDPEFLDPRLRLSDLDPRLAFLDPLNPTRNRDFITWADQRVHSLNCSQAGGPGPSMCNCRRVVKREVIQEPTKPVSVPQTRPLVAYQQSQ